MLIGINTYYLLFSSDFWIPGSDCPAKDCPYATFNMNASSTFKSLGTNFNITYGLGSSAGLYATDVVSIGGVSVANQTIGLASTTSNIVALTTGSATDPKAINGVLGIAFPALTYSGTDNNSSYNPFVFNLLDRKLITDPIFAIYLSSAKNTGWTGSVTFGGVDSSKHQGELSYVPLAPLKSESRGVDYYYWMVYAAGLGVVNSPAQDFAASASTTAGFIFDTGTTFTYLPTSIAQSIFTSMTGSSPLSIDTSTGAYLASCNVGNNSAVFQLKLMTNRNSTVNPTILNVPLSELLIPVGTASDGSEVCAFGIVPSDTSIGSGLYIIGDSILRSFYVVYDMSLKRIGVSPAIDMKSSIVGGTLGNSSNTSSNSTVSSSGNASSATTKASSNAQSLETSLLFLLCLIALPAVYL